jgi:hypothetical protein
MRLLTLLKEKLFGERSTGILEVVKSHNNKKLISGLRVKLTIFYTFIKYPR